MQTLWLLAESSCPSGNNAAHPMGEKKLGVLGNDGEGNGNPLQYSCLGEPMDRGAQRATIHGVARVGHDLATKQHQLKDLCAHMCSVMSDSLWPHGL